MANILNKFLMKRRNLFSITLSTLILAVSTLVGCHHARKLDIEIPLDLTVIHIDSTGGSKNVSALSDSVSYIQLQTSSDCLLGEINKMSFTNNKFFVLGSVAGLKTLYIFNSQGRFLYKINHIDPSSELNTSIADFDIIEGSDRLYVYFDDNRTIAVYNVDQQQLISTYVAPTYFTKFSIIADTLLFFRDGLSEFKDEYDNFRVCQFDLKGNIRHKWIDNPLNKLVNGGEIFTSKNGDSILIARLANDTIFSYKNSRISALYKISSDIESYGRFSQAKQKGEFINLLTDPRSAYLTRNIFNTKKYIYFFYKKRLNIGLLMYNKTDHSNYFIESINNDINDILITLPGYINDNYFVSIIYPDLIKKQCQLLSSLPDYQNKYQDLIHLNDQVSYDDNPVLCLMHLRN